MFIYEALRLLLMGVNPLLRPLEGLGPENLDLALEIGFVHIKIIMSRAV
jgi:hypothetical protein